MLNFLLQYSNYEDSSSTGTGLALGIMIFIYLAVIIVMVASMWKIFVKAGKPGWAAIVPIYNIVVYLEIIDRPVWWIILMLIPCVNIVISFILCMDLAKAFGKDTLWALGFFFLGIIFYPILAFGSSEYQLGKNQGVGDLNL